MAEDKKDIIEDEKKENEELESTKEKQESSEEEIEEYVPVYDDALNTSLTIDEIKDLNEEEIMILAQKVEVEIEKYEDLLMKMDTQGLSIEEINEQGYNDDEYRRLKALDKALYKNLRILKKSVKESGFFASIPGYCFVIFMAVAIITIYPISIFLPINICQALGSSFYGAFSSAEAALGLVFFLYIGLPLLIEVLILISFYIKGKKSLEKFKSFKSCLVLFIINLIIVIPSIITYFAGI